MLRVPNKPIKHIHISFILSDLDLTMKGVYICEYCGVQFSSSQLKYIHKKNSHKNCHVDKRMQILQHQLACILAEIERVRMSTQTVLPIATTNNITNNTTNNNNVTNNTINNNNVTYNTTNNNNVTNNVAININVFRREDTSYIQNDTLKQLNTNENLDESLMELIKLIHFNKDHPENMNVLVPNGAPFALVYKKNGWERAPIGQVAEFITYDASSVMLDHIQDYEHQYQQQHLNKFESWYNTIGKVPSLLNKAGQVVVKFTPIAAGTHNLKVLPE